MASSRKYRRSTSRNAASLLALALPAPLQRLANSQVGPLLMFFGVPAMIVIGLLQIDWQNGTPHLKVNTEKASELGQAVKGQLGNLENQPIMQHLEQTALDAWRSHQQSTQQQYPQQQYPQQQYPQQQYPQQQYPQQQYPQQQYPQQQYPQQQPTQPGSIAASNTPSGWATSAPPANYPNGSATGAPLRNSAAPFPSTSPPSSQYISAQSPTQSAATAPNYSQPRQQTIGQAQYQQQQYQNPQQNYSQQQNPQQNYSQQQYQQQPYSQQQPSSGQAWPTQPPWQSR